MRDEDSNSSTTVGEDEKLYPTEERFKSRDVRG
jgi:hypothetical protein